MANVISSFLVGIGFDYDNRAAAAIGTGIDSIKSKALQLGAVVAGAFGIKALTFDFAQSKDMLGKFSEVFGVTANDVQALGNALATEGGTLESFMAQLESIERARARIRVGDVAFFAPAGKAGINPNDIANARNATEAYLGLADSFAAMNQQQRINAAEALGLDEASIRLLSQGRASVEDLVAKYKEIRPITNEMTDSAAEFNRQWLEMKANIGGVADVISSDLLPVINDITKSINSWFGENRKENVRLVSNVFKVLAYGDIEALSEIGGNIKESDIYKNFLQRESYDDWFKSRPSGGGIDYKYGAPQEIDDPDVLDYINRSSPEPDYRNGVDQPIDQKGVLDYINRQPQASATLQQIDITLNLDGSVLDRRTVKVVNGIAQTAIDDLTSSTVA